MSIEIILLCAEVRQYLSDIQGIDVWKDVERDGKYVIVTLHNAILYDIVRDLLGEDEHILIMLEE